MYSLLHYLIQYDYLAFLMRANPITMAPSSHESRSHNFIQAWKLRIRNPAHRNKRTFSTAGAKLL